MPTSELKTVLLHGKMSNRRNRRLSSDFVLGESAQVGVGASAIAAGAAGLGGNAIGLVSTMGNSQERADYVTFDLDGKRVTGWLWLFPFNDGDELEVVAEQVGGGYNALAVMRPVDGLVAVFPHCTRGKWAHLRKLFKYWLISSTALVALVTIAMYFTGSFSGPSPAWFFPVIYAMYYAISLVLAAPIAYKYMKFVKMAEASFQTFGWSDVHFIDLYATSKASGKRKGDPSEYGQLIYRY